MAVPVTALAKLTAAALSDEDTRRKLVWIVAAICSPLILTLALICSLLSGSAEHNNSAVLLCFNGGNVDKKFFMDNLQLEESEYALIRDPQRGSCLYKCGSERYLLQVQAPEYKQALFGTAGGR